MMRRYGDDIKFIQWRNDLNSTSTNVFESPDGALPEECNFGHHLYDSIHSYARNHDVNSYYHNNDTFDRSSVEYPLRTEEYLKKIALIDMPCNNCGFKSECNQWDGMQLIFKDSLTPDEEAFFGIVINITLYLSLITQCPYGCFPKYFTIVYNLILQNLFYNRIPRHYTLLI